MPRKKAKNNSLNGFPVLAGLIALALVALALPAFAAGMPTVVSPGDGSICPSYSGFIYKIVTCVKDVSIAASIQFLVPFMSYAADMIGAFITLAFVFAGFLIATGRIQNLTKDGAVVAIKGAYVAGYAYFFGDIVTLVFDTMDWLLSAIAITTFYSSPMCDTVSNNIWIRLDCMLEMIIGGLLPGGSLYFGLVGFIVTCLFSGPAGFFLGLMGLVLIGLLLMGVAQCVYTFIMSCISLSLMVCVSPIFIPMVMLNVTKAYFEKFIRLLLGLIIQPAILFAYMSMMLLAFDVVMYLSPNSIYAALTGEPAKPKVSAPIGDYLATHNAYADTRHGYMINTMDLNKLLKRDAQGKAIQPGSTNTGIFSNMPKILGQDIDWSKGRVGDQLAEMNSDTSYPMYVQIQAVDFEELADARNMSLVTFLLKLFSSFFLAVVVAYILFTLLKHVPYLSASISGEFISGHYLSSALKRANPMMSFNLDGLQKGLAAGALNNAQKGGK